MKNRTTKLLSVLGMSVLLGIVGGCGSNIDSKPNDQSDITFIQTSNPNVAILEAKDLNDIFLFGLRVISVDNFFSSALNLTDPNVKVKLQLAKLSDGTIKLQALDAEALSRGRRSGVFVFDVSKRRDGQYLVDFSSAANPINMQLVNDLGAMYQLRAQTSESWKTIGKPKALKVMQDADTIVADVLHNISFTAPATEEAPAQSKSGKITVRVFLKRLKSVAVPFQASPTVSQGRKLNIGFFGAGSMADSTGRQVVQKFNIDTKKKTAGQLTVFLKDFDSDMFPVAERAILSWNKAFGFNAIAVKAATADIDLGDPRYTVVKWIDKMDDSAGWLGTAGGAIVHPDTGVIIAGSVKISGVYREKLVPLTDFSKKITNASIGGLPVTFAPGESPILPFGVGANNVNNSEFMHEVYYSTIMHEFGHVLGLRHNFEASTQLERIGKSDTPISIMDYIPLYAEDRWTSIGSYDLAAIRWAYFNETPAKTFGFCTDEDLDNQIDCNQFDFGDALEFIPIAVLNGVNVVQNLVIPFPQTTANPKIMVSAMTNLFKMQKLQAQIPQGLRSNALNLMSKAFAAVENAMPAEGVSHEAKSIIEGNIARLKLTYNKMKSGQP